MNRFIVLEKKDDYFLLDKKNQNHLKSLRINYFDKPINKNEILCIFKNDFYHCFYYEKDKAKIIAKLNINNEFNHDVILFAALIDFKRFEWLIEKATEFGVKKFYPLITKYTNNNLVSLFNNKKDRLNEKILNATQQCFRNKQMILEQPILFKEAINLFKNYNRFLAYEKEENHQKHFIFSGNVCFFVGPEGGFDLSEIEEAIKKEINIISLGKRILRSESASIYLLSNIDKNN